MKISQVVEFLEQVKDADGDLEVQSITGFWIRTVPASGERVVICVVGDGKALDEVLLLGENNAPRRG